MSLDLNQVDWSDLHDQDVVPFGKLVKDKSELLSKMQEQPGQFVGVYGKVMNYYDSSTETAYYLR
jgi:hypothetical protein